MNKYKAFFLSLNLLFFTIFVSNFGYSTTCTSQPEFIKIQSGSYELGEFSLNPMVYINPSLSTNPLTIDIVFENTELNCYDSNSVRFQLVPNSEFVTGGKYVESTGELSERTTFSFSFNPNYKIVNSLNSKYEVYGSFGSYNGNIVFKEDSTPPTLIVSGINTDTIIKSGDEISFNFDVSDSNKSGLKKILITGGDTLRYDYLDNDGNINTEPAPASYTHSPSSSRTYTIRVTDRLGNYVTETVSVKVDGTAPRVTSVSKVYDFVSNERLVKFSVIVEDESFKTNGLAPSVFGDFSKINSNFNNLGSSCTQQDVLENQYICVFDDIKITELTDTTNVGITFNVTDAVGNNALINKNEEVFIDTSNPQIIDFDVYNKLGIKNKVSLFDKNITVKLVARDKSILHPHIIIEDFGQIQVAPPQQCTTDSSRDELTCIWELGGTIGAFSGLNDLTSVVFKVVVVDNFGNSAEKEINIVFDSDAPQLSKEIEIIQTSDIKIGVLKSGEFIDFRITLDDENMISDGEFFVFGDFSSINYDDEYENMKATCSKQGSDNICEFRGIELNNGHLLTNVTFYVSDIMGNKNKFSKEIEIFAISDEINQSFDIDDMYILNPISRERMLDEAVTLWYEGVIETKTEGMEIILYNFISCNESQIKPFSVLAGEDKLYPQNIKYVREEEDNEFALKIKLNPHPAMSQLKKKTVGCSMAVLKRDSVNVYPEEIVDFKIDIDFFNSQRGGITQAIAQDIVDDIDSADLLGKKFDEFYKVYETLSTICSTVGTATALMSTISTSWTIVSTALDIYPPAEVANEAASTAIFGADGALSILNTGVIGTFCDIITCKNGGLITGGLFGGDTGLGEWVDDLNSLTTGVCTVGGDDTSTSTTSGGNT
ncbi:MAG: hypothetical protein HRU03_04315 [Nanoarchaeales archaeon]|nr:hypothetical protein [Nanoarchaeales archaeon]